MTEANAATELFLIDKVQNLLKEQSEYFNQRRKGWSGQQQLEVCKKAESDLRKYLKKRRDELTNPQHKLFS